MTIFAQVRRVNVSQRVLACRADAIVAAEAVIKGIRVVEICRQPARGRVTIVACVAGLNMVGVLPRGDSAIVTGTAGADDLQVVNGERRGPLCAGMAVSANVSRVDVRSVFARGRGAVMA